MSEMTQKIFSCLLSAAKEEIRAMAENIVRSKLQEVYSRIEALEQKNAPAIPGRCAGSVKSRTIDIKHSLKRGVSMCKEQEDVSIVSTTLILTLSDGSELKYSFNREEFTFKEERSSYCVHDKEGKLIDIVQNKQKRFTLVGCKGCTTSDFNLGIDVKLIDQNHQINKPRQ